MPNRTSSPTAPSIYGTRSIKRNRRTQAEINTVLDAVRQVLAGESGRITIRHLFYRLVGLRAIEKTEQSYKALIGHLSKWRHAGNVPFTAFADNTRWYHGSPTYDTTQAAIDNAVACYRKNLWIEQPVHLEIWCEKDAIAGVLSGVADSFGVPVFVCRGFASLTSIYEAALGFRRAEQNGKACHVAYFGDHDPSGVDIQRTIGERFAEFGANVSMDRVAVRESQIREYDLPTRPSKKTDTRGRGWVGECVEIDALPSNTLRGLVTETITNHIDAGRWVELQRVEAEERSTMKAFAAAWKGAAQ